MLFFRKDYREAITKRKYTASPVVFTASVETHVSVQVSTNSPCLHWTFPAWCKCRISNMWVVSITAWFYTLSFTYYTPQRSQNVPRYPDLPTSCVLTNNKRWWFITEDSGAVPCEMTSFLLLLLLPTYPYRLIWIHRESWWLCGTTIVDLKLLH